MIKFTLEKLKQHMGTNGNLYNCMRLGSQVVKTSDLLSEDGGSTPPRASNNPVF